MLKKLEMRKSRPNEKISDLEITDEMVRKPNASGGITKTIRRVMEEYDVESILDMYEDDYVPESRPIVQEPRPMFGDGGITEITRDQIKVNFT